jgi:hypothetical protein
MKNSSLRAKYFLCNVPNTRFRRTHILFAFTLLACLQLITSCQKEIVKQNDGAGASSLPETNISHLREKKIYVANLDELYTAVNDPQNEAANVILAPGTYLLNANYPNGGRLELLKDMTLQGQPGRPDAVVIDESSLPASSFSSPTARIGGIRLGKGKNALEWLTVKGGAVSANPFAVIAVDLPSSETTIDISHVKIEGNGSNIGIDIRNRLPEMAGRKITAFLEHNEITSLVNFFGFGIVVMNANNASEAYINLNMKENYIHGNKVGILVGNNAIGRTVINSKIDILSHADRFEGNGVALDPSGGVSQAATAFANNNSVGMRLYGSTIRNNNPLPLPAALQPVNGATPGGIYAAGGYSSTAGANGYNKTSNNKLLIELHGCEVSNNNGIDIYAYGAWCQPASLLAGTGNIVEISLFGISTNATVDAIPSFPFEPAGTNQVIVSRN